MSVPRQSYALLAASAPKAPKKYLPWADAVVSVGLSMFPDDWDAAEKALSDYTSVDRQAEITAISKAERPDMAMRAQYAAVMARLDGLGQGRGRWSDPKSESSRREAEEPLVREIEAVRQEISDRLPDLLSLKKRNDQRKVMLQRAVEGLADALMDGVSAYWYREGSTSPPVPLPIGRLMAARENDGFNLFVRGRIENSGSQHHIYVDADELAATFPPFNSARDEAALLNLPHLSPDLRLMIHVARLRHVTPENQPTVDELEALCRQHAPAFGLTFSLKSERPRYMARFIRDPIKQKSAP